MLYEFKVYSPVQPGRQSCFWYQGAIVYCRVGDTSFEAIACGAMVIKKQDCWEKIPWDVVARAARNDAGLDKLVGAGRKYFFDESTWFEVVNCETGDEVGTYFEYDEAVKACRQAACQHNRFEAPDL